MTTVHNDEKKSMMGKTLSKASQIVGVGTCLSFSVYIVTSIVKIIYFINLNVLGTPLYKQLKSAIIEGNEDKALALYNAKEMGKALKSTLHPSKPFPSKKDPNGETPLHLSSKYALAVLFGQFLEFGGRPDITNSRIENCLHTVCAHFDNPLRRAEIVDQILRWRSINPSTNKPVLVATDAPDIDGNTASHLAAFNGLIACLQSMLVNQVNPWRLNHGNLTSPEVADNAGRANVGSILELAWLFNPSTGPGGSVARWDRAITNYRARMREYGGEDCGVLLIDSDSLSVSGLMKFVARLIAYVSEKLGESAARAEVLLMCYNWDGRRLIKEFSQDQARVLQQVNIQSANSNDNQLVVRKGKKRYHSSDEQQQLSCHAFYAHACPTLQTTRPRWLCAAPTTCLWAFPSVTCT